jgi:pilus assembly protein TadC
MTELLSRALAEVSKVPPAEQEVLVSRLLKQVAAEYDFGRKIAEAVDRFAKLAWGALDEHRVRSNEGHTQR